MRDPELLFNNERLYVVLQNQELKTNEAVDKVPPSQLLTVNIEELIPYFLNEFSIEPISILVDSIYVDQNEAKIDISQDSLRFIPDRSKAYYVNGTQVTVHIPFQGDKNLFYYQPSTSSYNPPRAIVYDNEVNFIYEKRDHDAEALKKSIDRDIKNLQEYIQWVEKDVNIFNQQLEQKIRQRIDTRQKRILADQNMASSLGFPLKKREDALKTYSVPVSRKKVNPFPKVTSEPFKPEPSLESSEYEQILSIISNMVLVMERSPRAFQEMGEEDFRQHFLVQLNGQYEGQATGETFNYSGKTDILIRAEGKNIFIAECKFWRGEKYFLEAIDQLLSYASWRDTKTAILIFNRNKNFSDVINLIPELVKKHKNFKRILKQISETESRYVISNPGDENREIILTVMAFNVPGKEE